LKTNSAKSDIRAEALKRRDALVAHTGEKAAKDLAIKENFLSLPEYREARRILFFASFRSEVNTIPLIRKALEDGKTVLLPKVNRRERKLEIYEIKSLEDLKKGYMGIPEPGIPESLGGLPVSPLKCDIIVIPGAAFDPGGGRLGYGGGYYDRLLSQLIGKKGPHLIALAYEIQIMEEALPMESHDIKVQKIVTEKRAIDCHG